MTENKQKVRTELLGAVSSGEHDTPDETIFAESELVEWEFDERAVFELFSQKVYPDDEAGLRETLFNAYAAALRAAKQYDADPKVSVRLYRKDDGSLRLVIRDNGVGVTRETLDEAMVYIGRSQNRWVADVLGKFGVGGLAAFRLIPNNGIFLMHTHARDTGEEFRGAWWSRGFEIERGDELPDVFGEDEYGTRFEFPLKDDINRADVRSWVRHNAQHARVPVEYVETGFEEDNRTVYDSTRIDEYSDRKFSMTIETEFFRAVCSPRATGQELMLDAPLSNRVRRGRRRHGGHRGEIREPFNVDIRYKNENGPVVAGPHEGLTPVSEGEYADLPESVKDSFMKKTELTDDDIRMPFPTGTREQVEYVEEFYDWLRDQFAERYRTLVRQVIDQLDEPMDFFDLSEEERRVLFTSPSSRNIDVPQPGFNYRRHRTANMDLVTDDEEEQRFFALLQTPMTTYEPSSSRPTRRTVLQLYERDEPIYMGISLHDGRKELVHKSGGFVVELPDGVRNWYETGSDLYEPLEEWFGWNKLKNVTVSYAVEELGLSQETAEAALAQSSSDTSSVEGETVNIHFRDSSREVAVDAIRAYFEGDEDAYEDSSPRRKPPEELVVFTRAMDANLGDNRAFATDTRVLAHCSKAVADYLTEAPNVRRFDEAVADIDEPVISTTEGDLPVSELGAGDILHVAAGEEYDVFSEKAEAMKGYIQTLFNTPTHDGQTPVYGVVDPQTLADASKWLDTDDVHIIGPSWVGVTGPYTVNQTRVYAYARLNDWVGTEVFTRLNRNLFTDVDFDRGGKEIVDTLAFAAENENFDINDVIDGDAP